MATVISLINHKGGVGKTTSSANISAGLSRLGKKVLMIDLDSQANLTLHFGYKSEDKENIYHALRGACKLSYIEVTNNLHLIPSHLDLSASEAELINEAGREYILRDLLKPIEDNYDYIIIDCPPSLGLLTLNALSVSNTIIIPVELSSFALAGMVTIFEIVKKVQSRLNSHLGNYYLLMTKVDRRKTIQKDIQQTIRNTYKENVLRTTISTNVSIEESQLIGKDIFSYNSMSSGAKDYRNVCKEILKF